MMNRCIYDFTYLDLFKPVELETDLQRAVEQKEFVVYYQPQVDAATGRTLCLEALIRWMHPVKGLIMPKEFIPAAEKTGLIVPIGEWVIGEACRHLKIWQDKGVAPVRIAVNVSARQINQREFPFIVCNALKRNQLDAQFIELEITEGAAIADLGNTKQMLENLSATGVSISLDDFGKGYSSLEYLIHLPVNSLKIDKSFIDKITTDLKTQKLIKCGITLAHSLGLVVVAEGVETMEQYNLLMEINCDIMQGYLFSKPLPADEIQDYLFKRIADIAEIF